MSSLAERPSGEETNPYRSPLAVDESPTPAHLSRDAALFRFRIGAFLLSCSAFVNAFFLLHDHLIFLPANVLVISCIGLTAAFALFPLLERIALIGRAIFSPRSNLAAWNAAIYDSFHYANWLGLAGALLWTFWSIAFFELKVNFYLISYLVGPPAHILAACIYLPIIYGWFKASRTPPQTP